MFARIMKQPPNRSNDLLDVLAGFYPERNKAHKRSALGVRAL